MIPLRDVIPSRTTPWVTLLLIALNALVFAWGRLLAEDAPGRAFAPHGMIPDHFSWMATTASLFVHANLLHIGANLVALWLFGENVEDRFGHVRFLLYYICMGYTAAVAELWAGPASPAPLVGASGAIAGVIGAYMMMFPRSRVLVLVPSTHWVDLLEIPAITVIGGWSLMQIVGGLEGVGGTGPGGTAMVSLASGVVAGLGTAWLFRRPERQRVEWWTA